MHLKRRQYYDAGESAWSSTSSGEREGPAPGVCIQVQIVSSVATEAEPSTTEQQQIVALKLMRCINRKFPRESVLQAIQKIELQNIQKTLRDSSIQETNQQSNSCKC